MKDRLREIVMSKSAPPHGFIIRSCNSHNISKVPEVILEHEKRDLEQISAHFHVQSRRDQVRMQLSREYPTSVSNFVLLLTFAGRGIYFIQLTCRLKFSLRTQQE